MNYRTLGESGIVTADLRLFPSVMPVYQPGYDTRILPDKIMTRDTQAKVGFFSSTTAAILAAVAGIYFLKSSKVI